MHGLCQVSVLGSGSYGSVILVSDDSTLRRYALKRMSKVHLCANGKADKRTTWALREKTALENLSHPFIVGFHRSFEGSLHVYLLLDIAQACPQCSVDTCIARVQSPPTCARTAETHARTHAHRGATYSASCRG